MNSGGHMNSGGANEQWGYMKRGYDQEREYVCELLVVHQTCQDSVIVENEYTNDCD